MTEAKLCAVHGGSIGFQVLCTDLGGDKFTAIFEASGAAPYTVEIFRERSVKVEDNTGLHGFTAEDYELLRTLAQLDSGAADAICGEAFRAFDTLHDRLIETYAKTVRM